MRISDWSSDVCSSDLYARGVRAERGRATRRAGCFRTRDRRSAPRPHWGVARARRATRDRKSVVSGKSVSVRVDLGGRRIIKKKKHNKTAQHYTQKSQQ